MLAGNEQADCSDRTPPTEFLLAEYETLRTLRQDAISHGDDRFNYFLVILSGAIIFLTWINGSTVGGSLGQPDIVAAMNAAVIGVVLLLGLTTFARIAHRNASIAVYTRGMNRIRRFYVERHPEITQYIILGTDDNLPPFRLPTLREQLPVMLAILNGSVAMMAGIALLHLGLAWTMRASVLLGVLVLVGLFALQVHYYRIVLRNRLSKIEVVFPRSFSATVLVLYFQSRTAGLRSVTPSGASANDSNTYIAHSAFLPAELEARPRCSHLAA
jgi:hypothetical protein